MQKAAFEKGAASSHSSPRILLSESHGDSFGTCDCYRAECEVARAVRKAAAEKLLASVRSEYGNENDFYASDFPLWSFPSREWSCRAFPRRSLRACPGCGYVPSKVPESIKHGAVFALGGLIYRVIAVGSTNHYSNGLHYEDYAIGEVTASAAPWEFPDCPTPVADVYQALRKLGELPKFRTADLERALVLLGPISLETS
jgi:hypothetical protein